MASIDTVMTVLQQIWGAYNRYPPADARDAAYLAWQNAFRHVADNDLRGAAESWIGTQPNVPVPTSLLEVVDAHRRTRNMRAPLDDGGMLPEPLYPIDPAKSFGVIKHIRKMASEGFDHEARMAYIRSQYRPDFTPGDDAKTYACLTCRDNRFVVVPKTNNSVRPCQDCNEAAFERWAKGHFRPNHHCAECEDIRRGRRSRRGADE